MKDSDEVVFRSARLEDVPMIVEVVESAYRDTSRPGWTTEADLIDGPRTDEQMISELMSDPNCVFLVGFIGQKLVASVLIARKSDHIFLEMLAVHTSAQNLGFGRKILNASEAFARLEWNLNLVRITVIDRREELVDWYSRRGFSLTGETEIFPTDPRSGRPKINNLNLVVMAKAIV